MHIKDNFVATITTNEIYASSSDYLIGFSYTFFVDRLKNVYNQ